MLRMDANHTAKKRPMSLRIGGALADRLMQIAEAEHNSVSAVARRLITAGLRQEGKHVGRGDE